MEKLKGFTLAEVLITLAIIGVVAAMTMPTLLADYQKRQFETARTVFLKRMQDAASQMNMDGRLEGFTDTADFMNTFKKYVQVAKVCSSGELQACFHDIKADVPVSGGGTSPLSYSLSDLNTLKKLRGGGGLPTDTDDGTQGLVLANGYNALMAYDPACSLSGDVAASGARALSCVVMIYDTNGAKGPNKMGKDVQGFNTLVPLNDFTPVAIDTCSTDSPYYRKGNAYCATDLWAGAKKACEDLGLRLPSSPVTTGCSYFNDGQVANANDCTAGAKNNNYNPLAVAEGTEPRTIWNWCKNNTCSSSYWLSEVYVPNPNNSYAMTTNSSNGHVGYANRTHPNPKGRCVL